MIFYDKFLYDVFLVAYFFLCLKVSLQSPQVKKALRDLEPEWRALKQSFWDLCHLPQEALEIALASPEELQELRNAQ